MTTALRPQQYKRIAMEIKHKQNLVQCNNWEVEINSVEIAQTDKLTAYIYGPEGTPYEGGVFKISILFSREHPFKPPLINFITPIMHPNIHKDGRICMEILHNQYSPMVCFVDILNETVKLLKEPCFTCVVDIDCQTGYNKSPNEFQKSVEEHTFANRFDQSKL